MHWFLWPKFCTLPSILYTPPVVPELWIRVLHTLPTLKLFSEHCLVSAKIKLASLYASWMNIFFTFGLKMAFMLFFFSYSLSQTTKSPSVLCKFLFFWTSLDSFTVFPFLLLSSMDYVICILFIEDDYNCFLLPSWRSLIPSWRSSRDFTSIPPIYSQGFIHYDSLIQSKFSLH